MGLKKLTAMPRRVAKAIFAKNDSVGVSGFGFSGNLPTSLSSVPRVTRYGLNPDDDAPFYEMDPDRLWRVYHGYRKSLEHQHQVLYADAVAFRRGNMGGITLDALDIDTLKIEIVPTRYHVPRLLEAHAEAMIGFFKSTGRLNWKPELNDYENNRTAKVVAFDTEKNLMTMQEASYFDQVATNLTVDTDSGALPAGADSIRQDLEPPIEGHLPPLDTSMLVNSLGVAAMVYTPSGTALWRVRNPKMGSITKEALHCSVSGVYEIPDYATRSGSYGYELLEYGIRLEVGHELGLEDHEYDLYPVAFARELPRAGKPQMFFVVISHLDEQALAERARNARERVEYVRNEFHEFLHRQPDAKLADSFTYEGLAAFHYTELYLEANEGKFAFSGGER